jgi:hypothetical protein
LRIVVSPLAVTAASIAFLVAPTDGIRNSISPPVKRPSRAPAIK